MHLHRVVLVVIVAVLMGVVVATAEGSGSADDGADVGTFDATDVVPSSPPPKAEHMDIITGDVSTPRDSSVSPAAGAGSQQTAQAANTSETSDSVHDATSASAEASSAAGAAADPSSSSSSSPTPASSTTTLAPTLSEEGGNGSATAAGAPAATDSPVAPTPTPTTPTTEVREVDRAALLRSATSLPAIERGSLLPGDDALATNASAIFQLALSARACEAEQATPSAECSATRHRVARIKQRAVRLRRMTGSGRRLADNSTHTWGEVAHVPAGAASGKTFSAFFFDYHVAHRPAILRSPRDTASGSTASPPAVMEAPPYDTASVTSIQRAWQARLEEGHNDTISPRWAACCPHLPAIALPGSVWNDYLQRVHSVAQSKHHRMAFPHDVRHAQHFAQRWPVLWQLLPTEVVPLHSPPFGLHCLLTPLSGSIEVHMCVFPPPPPHCCPPSLVLTRSCHCCVGCAGWHRVTLLQVQHV